MSLKGTQNAISAETLQKWRLAVRLAREGKSWDDIADLAGYASRGAAFSAVQSARKLYLSELYDEVELYRQEALDRLRDMLKELWPRRADEKVAAVLLKVILEINRLHGGDRPQQIEIGEADLARLRRELEAEIGRRAIADVVRGSRGPAAPAAEGGGGAGEPAPEVPDAGGAGEGAAADHQADTGA